MTYKNQAVYENSIILGSYLAGLWEGDGHITLQENNKPSFHINFNIKDAPVAEKLLNYITRHCPPASPPGSIRYQPEKTACVLNIWSIEGLKFIVYLINGKCHTPKAYQINIIIDWLNSKNNTTFAHADARSADILLSEDAWFAGFIDSDGSFGVEHSEIRVACRFRVAQRKHAPIQKKLYASQSHEKSPGTYEFIMSTIASYLCVKLNVQTQKKSGRNYYLVSMASAKSKKILRAYLDRFPLLTSKYLDYKDWCAVDDLMIKQLHYAQQSHTIIEAKKNGMNDSRTVFNWDHLNLF